MPDWFYYDGVTRSGPFSEDDMRGMARSGDLTPETLCWTAAFGELWRPFRETAFYTDHPSSVAAGWPRSRVNDVYVWIIAVSPVAVLALQIAVGALGVVSAATVGQLITIITGAVVIYCVIVDTKQLDRLGRRNGVRRPSAWWALFSPVYLWRRATFLGRTRTNFWVYIACIVASLGLQSLILAAVLYTGSTAGLPACDSRVADSEVRNLANSLAEFKTHNVTATVLGQQEQVSNTGTLRSCKGVLTMSDATLHPLTYSFEQRPTEVYVQIVVQ